MQNFQERNFQIKLQAALQQVQLVLHAAKAKALDQADRVLHKYDDKYMLAEQMVGGASASLWNGLMALGISAEHYELLKKWRQEEDRAVSIMALFTHSCVFEKETVREEESPTVETEIKGTIFREKVSTKVITKIKEYVYGFSCQYRLVAYKGVYDPTYAVVLTEHTSQQSCVQRNKNSPYPERSMYTYELNLTWLLDVTLRSSSSLSFAIDRSADSCHTPRRNTDVHEAMSFYDEVSQWSASVNHHLVHQLFAVQLAHTQSGNNNRKVLAHFNGGSDVFNPVLPILYDGDKLIAFKLLTASERTTVTQQVLGGQDLSVLLREQERTLAKKLGDVQSMLAAENNTSTSVMSMPEVRLAVVTSHFAALSERLNQGLDYLEFMLRKQLVAAIGRELTVADFSNYMNNFHYRKLLGEAYVPQPFVYAVRRSFQHSPEGNLRIEADFLGKEGVGYSSEAVSKDGVKPEAIVTFHKVYEPSSQHEDDFVEFSLSASSRARFRGEKHVHGYLAYGFSTGGNVDSRGRDAKRSDGSHYILPNLRLVAVARQFSSYIVLLGRMSSASQFDAKHAFILQNKDEFVLPLLLEPIPTPKQFRDAIASLSPEQQRFAQAFRSMQLEGSLFTVVLVQIKPQLEAVLHLPADSLTKEIKLTQDLMRLFVEHQIPPDLLAFDANDHCLGESASAADRVGVVKTHVSRILALIEEAKQDEIKEANQKREYETGKPHVAAYTEEESNSDGGFMMNEDEEDDCDMEMLQDRSMELVQQSQSFTKTSAKMKSKSVFGALGGLMRRGSGSDHVKMKESVDVNLERSMEKKSRAPPKALMASGSKGGGRGGMGGGGKPLSAEGGGGGGGGGGLEAAPAVMGDVSASKPDAPASEPSKQDSQQADNSDKQNPDKQSDEQVVNQTDYAESVDVTKIPALLDAQYSALDSNNAIRPTILNVSPTWTKRVQGALLGKEQTSTLGMDEQAREKQKAFDLLDALTRSGGLELLFASLHVIVAATHGFEQDVLESVVCRNMNIIERVERSALILASTLHGKRGREVLRSQEVEKRINRIWKGTPADRMLLLSDDHDEV